MDDGKKESTKTKENTNTTHKHKGNLDTWCSHLCWPLDALNMNPSRASIDWLVFVCLLVCLCVCLFDDDDDDGEGGEGPCDGAPWDKP